MAVWYIRDNGTIGWSGVTAWSNHTAVAGELRRQSTTPTVGNERVFIAIVGGATGASQPTWVVTKGAKTTDGSVTWQECTGQPAVNGDLTNTPLSSSVRSTNPGLGKIIQNNAGTGLFICSTAGTCGASEPTYNTAAVGNTTTDSSCTWTYIGTSFSIWAAPHARLENAHATNWGTHGDTFYCANDHSQTQTSSLTLDLWGTISNPTLHFSIDHTASLPPGSGNLLSGATIATTSGGSIGIYGNNAAIFDGFVFSGNGGLTLAQSFAGGEHIFKNCALKKTSTGASAGAITAGVSGTRIVLDNTTMQFGATGDSFDPSSCDFLWRNTPSAIQGATLPTTLINPSTQSGGIKILEGVDLSALDSGKTIVGSGANNAMSIYLINCKLGSGVTVAAAPANPSGPKTFFQSSDSSGTISRHGEWDYRGTLTSETTIVRTGGATDGTTPLAWRIVTTANSKFLLPFESFPISIWNGVTGSGRTLTVYGIWGSGSLPNNDDIWIDVEYLGDSGSPLASVATSTKANNLATGVALDSDSSIWGGSSSKFKMTVTFTAQLAGYVRVYVKAAKPSSTFYIDPQPALS
jgi:hypothetical protein